MKTLIIIAAILAASFACGDAAPPRTRVVKPDDPDLREHGVFVSVWDHAKNPELVCVRVHIQNGLLAPLGVRQTVVDDAGAILQSTESTLKRRDAEDKVAPSSNLYWECALPRASLLRTRIEILGQMGVRYVWTLDLSAHYEKPNKTQ